jgi:hypothetical protein
MIHDKWARIIGIPLISLIIPLIQDFEEMMAFNRSTLRHFIACLVFTTAKSFLYHYSRYSPYLFA